MNLSDAALRERAFENVHDVPTGGQYRNTEVHEWCTPCKRVLKSFIALRDAARAEPREIWVIEEGVEGEGVYTLAICCTEEEALAVKAFIERERGHACPNLVPERYTLPKEYAAAIRSQSPSLKGEKNE